MLPPNDFDGARRCPRSYAGSKAIAPRRRVVGLALWRQYRGAQSSVACSPDSVLRDFNTITGTLFAAAINVVVAVVSLALASSTPSTLHVSGPATSDAASAEPIADYTPQK